VHAAAPYYSVLIRVPPDNPASTTEFVCDLLRRDAQADRRRQDLYLQDPPGREVSRRRPSSPRRTWPRAGTTHRVPAQGRQQRPDKLLRDGRQDRGARRCDRDLPAEARHDCVPARSLRSLHLDLQEETLEKDPHWYEKNILGSGPFKFVAYEVGQSIKGARNPDYYHKGQPYLDAIEGIFADKQSVRVEALRGDRAAIEFRGLPPSARDQLVKEAGKDIVVQDSDWNCGNILTPNHKKKPFDDVRVRKALALAIDQWTGAPALAKIANVRTVGGIVFPGSPLAATKEELQQIAGFWPDIEKSRAEAKRLLKEAWRRGAEVRAAQPQRRPALQVCRHLGGRRVEEDRPQCRAEGRADSARGSPTCGPGTFDVAMEANCQSVVNPVLDTGKYLPHTVYPENYGGYEDPKSIELYEKMQTETDPKAQRAYMRAFEKHTLDHHGARDRAALLVPHHPGAVLREGWKISPSHYLNQDLANVWLDK